MEAEDVESLALLAARGDEVEDEDGAGETSMQRYTRRILAVSSLLEADRLRQVGGRLFCLRSTFDFSLFPKQNS